MDGIVFLDWQNIYRRARDCFHDDTDDDFTLGQVHPAATATELLRRSEANAPVAGKDLHLKQIRIYRGQPDQEQDSKGYAAFRRQAAAWSLANNRTEVVSRVLRGYPHQVNRDGVCYTTASKVREKGIDVALAIDLVTMAIEGEYDRAVVFSGDHDIAPALEYVLRWAEQQGKALPIVEVAAWRPDGERGFRLNVTRGQKVFCHWLDSQTYHRLCDDRDYTVASSAGRPRPGPR